MTIHELIRKHPNWGLPANCPECGQELCVDESLTHITCENEACPTHLLGRLQKWTNTIEVKGFGDAVLQKLMSLGVMSIADLYTKDFYDALSQCEGFGEKSANKIFSEITASKQKPMSLAKFVTALNIKGIGEEQAQKILSHTSCYTLDHLMSLETKRCVCPGIGHATAEKLTLGIHSLVPEIIALESIINIEDPRCVTAFLKTGGSLCGLSFCFTGAMSYPRKQLEKLVVDNGGDVKGVAAGLNYLVQADPSSTSNKTQKANKLGVKIISEQEFLKMVGEI